MDKNTEKSTAELTHEIFDLWSKTYEATYGRLFEIPAVGPLRERYEKAARSYSTSVNLYSNWLESLANFQSVFMEAMRKMGERMVAETKGEASPEIYKDFYRVWIETYSDTFKEFLKSSRFSLDMGELTSNFVDFQKINRELLDENILKPLKFPTKAEIDEMNKEIYDLKKTAKSMIKEQSHKKSEIQELSDNINRINQELDSLRETIEGLTGQIRELSEKR